MPKFLLKFQAAVLKEITIEKTPVTIGRKPDNDIVIDNMAVSGHHAKLTLQGSSYVVEDLQSTNGTFINQKRVLSSVLRHEDAVLIGQHTLVFLFPESLPQPEQSFDSDATVVLPPPSAQPPKPAEPVAPPPPPAPEPAPQQPVQPQQTPAHVEPAKEEQPAPAAPPAPQPPPPAAAAEAQPQQQIHVPAAYPPPKTEHGAMIRVIEGKTDAAEYPLNSPLTYIGKSENAAIKIKGLFAPDIAALISRRPTGFLITAVKDGYPKLNGISLSGQAELKDGDVIEAGGLKLIFQLKEGAKQP